MSAAALVVSGCGPFARLGRVIQPPRFEQVEDRPAEVRLILPGLEQPAGAAAVRLWTRVSNPNPISVTLTTLAGSLFLEESRAATASFPLGLPLRPGEGEIVSLDLTVSFAELPGLAGPLRRATEGSPVAYRLEGTIGVDAGPIGQPTFGPMTLLTGELRGRQLP